MKKTAKKRQKRYIGKGMSVDQDSLKKFRRNIINNFSDPAQVKWFDENILLVLRHKTF